MKYNEEREDRQPRHTNLDTDIYDRLVILSLLLYYINVKYSYFLRANV